MFYACPQCGDDTKTLNEGYCEDCRARNQQALDDHNAKFDWWNSLSDQERNEAIKRAIR